MAPAVLLVALWIAYVTATYGVTEGILRNPSLERRVPLSTAEHLRTRALNVVNTFIPGPYAGYPG